MPSPLGCTRSVARAAALAAIVAVAPALARAQDTSAARGDPRPSECFTFAFGAWDPPLDWSAAGQRTDVSPPPPSPEAGRGDASHAGVGGDSTLMLYPGWWPAGVLVRFTTRSAAGDTLRGTATALVADGRLRAPRAPIIARRIPCGAPRR